MLSTANRYTVLVRDMFFSVYQTAEIKGYVSLSLLRIKLISVADFTIHKWSVPGRYPLSREISCLIWSNPLPMLLKIDQAWPV